MPKTGGALFVTGVAELDAKLRNMSFRIQGRILRDAMKAAMQPVLSTAKETIPSPGTTGSGYTRSRLRIRTGKPNRDGSRTVRVGIFGPARHGRGKNHDKVPTGRIIEFGKEGQEGQQILRKALAAKEAQAISTLTARLRAGVLANLTLSDRLGL